MSTSLITLASDFGSPYPAAMKGVICQRTDARLVDVAHDLPRQDVRAAAFWLREVLPYFPSATHLVVVDPGVGTDRAAIVLQAGDHVLVGPDNGVLRPVARRLAGGGSIDAFVVDEDVLGPVTPSVGSAVVGRASTTGGDDGASENAARPASNTFHGRDVFAPVAADVHDTPLDQLEAIEYLSVTAAANIVDLELPEARVERGTGNENGTETGNENGTETETETGTGDGRAIGEVLVVDDFGNVITNVPGGFLAGCERIVANGESVPVGETFAAVPAGERLATVGSHGYVELDVNLGRGDEAFGLEPADEIVLETG